MPSQPLGEEGYDMQFRPRPARSRSPLLMPERKRLAAGGIRGTLACLRKSMTLS